MLFRNDVFADLSTNRKLRLLQIMDKDNAITFDMEDAKALPVKESYSTLLSLHQNSQVIIEKGQLAAFNAEHASPKAKARKEEAWQRIEPLLSNPEIYLEGARWILIEERAKQVGCSATTILKDLRRYWFGGQTPNALLGHFHKCGYKQPSHSSAAGRKPQKHSYTIYQLNAEDEENAKKAIEKVYLKKTGTGTIDAAYQWMVENFYSYNDGNGDRYVTELGYRPTLRQFRSVLHKHYSFELITRKRKSDTEFERNHSDKTGSVLIDCRGIGHIYEIDATIADVFLVAAKDRSRIIGKPTLYLVIDRYSRLIVGFYVGLEAASWPAAQQAILSITEDKAALCARYGIKYELADWPAEGLFPEMFLADRGEMLSNDSGLIVNGLKITVGNLPKERPEHKPIVEGGIRLIQMPMAPVVPGYEPPENVKKRRGKKYDKDAALTLDEFTGIVIHDIIMRNRLLMENYPFPIDWISRGVRPIPCEIWSNEIVSRAGALIRFSEVHVRFSLLPKDEAVVTREGIRFKGCFYVCTEAFKNGWFIGSGKGVWKVVVSFDRRLVDAIYIHDPKDPTKHFIAHLSDKSRAYKGLSFTEVEVYEQLVANVRSEAEQIKRQELSGFHAYSGPVITDAEQKTKAVTKGKSRSGRRADTAQDRMEERQVRRQTEAAMTPSASPNSSKATVIPLPQQAQHEDFNEPIDSGQPKPLTPQERMRLNIQKKQQEMLKEIQNETV